MSPIHLDLFDLFVAATKVQISEVETLRKQMKLIFVSLIFAMVACSYYDNLKQFCGELGNFSCFFFDKLFFFNPFNFAWILVHHLFSPYLSPFSCKFMGISTGSIRITYCCKVMRSLYPADT